MSISQSSAAVGSVSAAAAGGSQQEARLTASQNASHQAAASANLAAGKPASLARAEMLRRKEAEEAERKAKEKEERRQVMLAAREKRAKAAQEEEQEREKKKRAREETDRAKRMAHTGSDALSSVPAAGRGSTIMAGSMNGSVKAKYGPVAGSTISAATGTAAAAAAAENGKKRRTTTDKEATNGMAQATAPQSLRAPQQPPQPPKLNRTMSQSSIRAPAPSGSSAAPPAGPSSFKASLAGGMSRAGAHLPGQPIRFGSSVNQGIPSSSSSAALVAKQHQQQQQQQHQQQQAAQQAKRPSNFSSQNPFQQAALLKQQQIQQQLQLQKQRQLQQQQQQAAAAAAATAAAAAKAQENDYDSGDADEALPDVNSEYSDSEDEETILRRAEHPSWTQGESLQAALLAQATMDADEIFGIPQGPVRLEEILPSQHSLMRIRRPRSSSANWSGPDGLAQWEIDRYNHRLGIRGAGVLLNPPQPDGQQQPPQPQPRLSHVPRRSTQPPSKDDHQPRK